MNLKDAFRTQNKLQLVMNEAIDILEEPRNILKIKTTHLRARVMKEAQDGVVEEEAPSEYAGCANQLAQFLLFLMKERETLSQAIREAKGQVAFDLDSEVGAEPALADPEPCFFRNMASPPAAKKIIPDGGCGYRFNGEGNQVMYR